MADLVWGIAIMNLTNADSLQLFYGKPLNVNDICLVYFPTLGDIAEIGAESFYHYTSLLTMDKKELFESPAEMSELQYLIALSLTNQEFFELIQKAFSFFIKEEITILADLIAIQVGTLDEQRLLFENDFILLQTHIKQVCALGKNEIHKSTDSEHVRAIKEKIRKGQALVAQIKAKDGKEDGAPEMVDLISCFLAGATEVNICTIWDMPYYMFQIQFRRMQMIEEFTMQTQASLAGAKISQDKMKHWIRKIQET